MVGRQAKNRFVATVRDGILLTQGDPSAGATPSILVVGSEAWYAWLAGATMFTYASAEGHYTARKERFQRGGWYWKAYRSVGGKLYRSYLGKSEALDLARLANAVNALNEQATSRTEKKLWLLEPEINGSIAQTKTPRHRRTGRELNSNFTLLIAKLRIPSLPLTLVSRPRLIEWLDQAAKHPVVLVAGPAGSGKTTMVADWATRHHHDGSTLAWIQLDPADSDPARYWRHVLTALERTLPGLGLPGLTLLDRGDGVTGTPFPMDELVAVLLDELGKLAQPLWLILDDYHHVTSKDIHNAMATLVAYLPPVGHLIISSREDVPFSDARLRAYERLVELKPSALRFTNPEAQTYLSARSGVHLNEPKVVALNAATEGWIAGLQLAALALERMPQAEQEAFVDAFTRGQSPELVDFLIEEALDRLESGVRNFLLRTAVLNQLCGPLCDALMGGHDGQRMLEQLERTNLFLIALDTERHWYRYHHLFAEVMRMRLAREYPDLVLGLYAQAARWHATQGDFAEAAPYALASGDFLLAADVIERAAPVLERQGETMTLLGWLAAVPNDVLREHPLLCLSHARLLLVAGQAPQAQANVEMAESAIATPHVHDRTPRSSAAELAAQLLALRSDLLMVSGDYRGALEVAKEVYAIHANIGAWRAVLLGSIGALHGMLGEPGEGLRAYREAEIVSRAAGDIASLLENLFGQGSMLGTLGQLREASALYRLAVDVAEAQPGGPPPVAGASYWNLARALYEWDEREVAWQPLREGLRLNRRYGDLALLARCYLVQGRLYRAQGELAGVRETLRQLQELAVMPQVRPTTAQLSAAMVARLSLAQGDIERAEEWAHQSGLTSTDQPGYRTEFGHMTLVRLLLAREHYDEAFNFASRLLEDAEHTGRIDKMIELCLLRAIALEARGTHGDAITSFARSLALAERGGYVRLFVDEGHHLAFLLSSLMQSKTDNGPGSPSHYYLQRIHLAVNHRAPSQDSELPRTTNQVNPSALSERELEVLRRVDAGLSDAEIASELVVELSTVRWHLRNIFQKLGAHRRTQALAIGRSLGLL